MQRYTKCVPFYRINYLALYSILSFIQRGGRANAARFYHTRIYYSHASFSPSFVFTSRMTHRRIIFASRVRLLISSHAFLRVRSLSFFPPPFSIFYFTPLFLFFYFSFSLAPESTHDRKEKDGTAHGTTHGLAFVARWRTIRIWAVVTSEVIEVRKAEGKRIRRPTASVNCRCNNAPAETKDSGDFCRRFSARAEERKDGLEIETPFKELCSRNVSYRGDRTNGRNKRLSGINSPRYSYSPKSCRNPARIQERFVLTFRQTFVFYFPNV